MALNRRAGAGPVLVEIDIKRCRYRRFVGRSKTHEVESDPGVLLNAVEVEQFRRWPEEMIAPDDEPPSPSAA